MLPQLTVGVETADVDVAAADVTVVVDGSATISSSFESLMDDDDAPPRTAVVDDIMVGLPFCFLRPLRRRWIPVMLLHIELGLLGPFAAAAEEATMETIRNSATRRRR